MGQYLCIGLRTRLCVKHHDLKQPFTPEEKSLEEIERKLVPSNLYEKQEIEDHIVYKLRSDVADAEMIPFLKDFYRMRYSEIDNQENLANSYIGNISEYKALEEWLELANKKMMEGFQIDHHHDYVTVNRHCSVDYAEECIILSLTGKVWMECYDNLFRFFENCIKRNMPDYKLAAAISVFLTD